MIIAQWLQTFCTMRRWTTLIITMLCSGIGLPGWSQGTTTQDYSRITQIPRAEIDTWLKQEVAASSGNWNTDRYHFYIGFSTGHFGQDPVHAIAMRRLAFSLMNNSLTAGDRITPIAWEMTTWNVGSPVTLSDAPTSRAEFVNGVPYAPHSGSQGGHDIERVLYETVTKVIPADEIHSSIVLLLTNSNASQAPTGERVSLFGADNPQLAEVLRSKMFRLPAVRKEFRLQAGPQPVNVALTALFPQKLNTLPNAPHGPRYPTFARETWQPQADLPSASEVLPNLTRPDTPHAPEAAGELKHTGIPIWVWAMAGVAIIVAIVAYLLRPHKSVSPTAAKTIDKTHPTPPSAIPGSLTVTIGPDPQTLQPLTTANRWFLLHDETWKVTLVDAPKTIGNTSRNEEVSSLTGTILAKIGFNEKLSLQVDSEAGVQFIKLQGTAASQSNSHRLLIEPGKRAFCRILPPNTTTETRFEVVFDAQKGSRI